MTEENKLSLEKFISACDELITCKYLIAESKIQKLLGVLAETPQATELVADCMEQFNRDREIAKAFIQEGKMKYACVMPEEEFKIIGLVFCILVDINNGRVDFNDFIRRFFSEGQNSVPFKNFIFTMILPFRNLIAEAFGYPKIDLRTLEDSTANNSNVVTMKERERQEVEQPAVAQESSSLFDEKLASKILRFPSLRNLRVDGNLTELDNLYSVCQRIAAQILEELDMVTKNEELVDELNSICYSIIMATSEQDFDILRGLALGLKYASKGVKSIKFLVREMLENIDKYYRSFFG